MKPKVFVPKDRIGNEESRHRSCPRPISYPDGRQWEADGGVNQKAALPYFPPRPGHPQALARGGGAVGLAATTVTTCSRFTSARSVLSISLPLPHSFS